MFGLLRLLRLRLNIHIILHFYINLLVLLDLLDFFGLSVDMLHDFFNCFRWFIILCLRIAYFCCYAISLYLGSLQF